MSRNRSETVVLSASSLKNSSCCSASIWVSKFKNHSNDFWSRLIQKKSTFLRLCIACPRSVNHLSWHLGHSLLEDRYLYIMDCKMDEKGVTPMPVATRTACSALKMLEAGAPKGPSKWISSNSSLGSTNLFLGPSLLSFTTRSNLSWPSAYLTCKWIQSVYFKCIHLSTNTIFVIFSAVPFSWPLFLALTLFPVRCLLLAEEVLLDAMASCIFLSST